MKYWGPLDIRYEFENVLLKFFDISPDGTPATLCVYEYAGRYMYKLEIGNERFGDSPSLKELNDVLEEMESRLSILYERKRTVTVSIHPEDCEVGINGTVYSTSTSLRLKPGTILEYVVLSHGWSATRTAHIGYDSRQNLRITPSIRKVIVPSSGVYILNQREVEGIVEVPEGFYHLKVIQNDEVVYDDVVCVFEDLDLASVKFESDGRKRWVEIPSSGKMMVVMNDVMMEVPPDTSVVFKARNRLYIVTDEGIRTDDGRYLCETPVVAVIPEEYMVFFSDGRVVNLLEDWERDLYNPVISWAKSGNRYYLLTTTGEVYLFTPSRRTFERLFVRNVMGLVSHDEKILMYTGSRLEDMEGKTIYSSEFPIVGAASDGEYVYLLLSTGTIEVFPGGRKILSGSGKLWNFGNEVVFISEGRHFLFILKDGRKKESKYFFEGMMGVCRVDETIQVVTPSKIYVLRMMEE